MRQQGRLTLSKHAWARALDPHKSITTLNDWKPAEDASPALRLPLLAAAFVAALMAALPHWAPADAAGLATDTRAQACIAERTHLCHIIKKNCFQSAYIHLKEK